MHKPRQAIPECSANMHWIKEVVEAQILRQAELLKEEHTRTCKLTRGTTPNNTAGGYARGIRHKLLHRARDKE